MVEVTPQAQLIIGTITFVVFSTFIIKTIKNISSTNDDDIMTNLDKLSERKKRINKKYPCSLYLSDFFKITQKSA